MTRKEPDPLPRPPDPRCAELEQENAALRQELVALHLKLERLTAGTAGAADALEAAASQQIARLIAERDQLSEEYQGLLDQVVEARQNVYDLYQRRLSDYAQMAGKTRQLDQAVGHFRPAGTAGASGRHRV